MNLDLCRHAQDNVSQQAQPILDADETLDAFNDIQFKDPKFSLNSNDLTSDTQLIKIVGEEILFADKV